MSETVNSSSKTVKISGTTRAARSVLVVRRKKKKKKYSRGTKDLQDLVEGVIRASARTTRAVSAGVTHYDKRSRRSARKRRDGAVWDGLENWARGIGKTVRKSAGAPNDIAKRLNTKAVRRQLRAMTRLGVPFVWRR